MVPFKSIVATASCAAAMLSPAEVFATAASGWQMVAQCRDLDYDFGDKIDKLSFNGPAIAVNFRW